jgi:hypothetical protein
MSHSSTHTVQLQYATQQYTHSTTTVCHTAVHTQYKNTHEVTKIHSRITTQYTKDQLQLVAIHIGKATDIKKITKYIIQYVYYAYPKP